MLGPSRESFMSPYVVSVGRRVWWGVVLGYHLSIIHSNCPQLRLSGGDLCKVGTVKIPTCRWKGSMKLFASLSLDERFTASGQERIFFTSGLHMLLEAAPAKLISLFLVSRWFPTWSEQIFIHLPRKSSHNIERLISPA